MGQLSGCAPKRSPTAAGLSGWLSSHPGQARHTDDFVLVPAGTSHTFGNRSATASRLLVMRTPALDASFVELEALGRDPAPRRSGRHAR